MSERPTPSDRAAIAAETTEVAIIGAGPAGAVAAAMLAARGRRVTVIEAAHFPRFAIGESLLPQCLMDLEKAGLAECVEAAGYRHKNGARFVRGAQRVDIDFADKSTPGEAHAFQVPRADFDHRLIQAAIDRGAVVRFGERVCGVDRGGSSAHLVIENERGERHELRAAFVLDASGGARVLSRLIGTRAPTGQLSRQALFTHLSLRETSQTASDQAFDGNRIQIGLHPSAPVWYWLIPFADGCASLGFVGRPEALASMTGGAPDAEGRFDACLGGFDELPALVERGRYHRPVAAIDDYSTSATTLHGPGYALLGNAGAFLDPIFSSGVTVAIRAAVLAAPLVERELEGEAVDWAQAFEAPMRRGLETFRAFVDAWYDGRLPAVIFHPDPPTWVRRHISAVLAGYAWDDDNPFTRQPRRHLDTLAALCGYDA